MDDNEFLATRFEEQRGRLRAVAYRMLGSAGEAEDAVQEAWLRLSRTDADGLHNLPGWLTTVVGRVCLDMLRARALRREDPLDAGEPEHAAAADGPREGVVDPEQEALLADSVGLALLVVLDTLAPAERLAFVLHDLFAVPFDEISAIVDRSPAAARQLASRARRRVQGASPAPDHDQARRRRVVDAFLAASRGGDFEALLTLLDPDVVLRADTAAVESGALGLVRGAKAVAGTFSSRARGARPALVDGVAALVWAPAGQAKAVFSFTIVGGRITGIDLLADPDRLSRLDVVLLDA